MSFKYVKTLVTRSLPHLTAGASRTKPADRALVQRLINRFQTDQQDPLPAIEEGATLAIWGQDADEQFIAWLLERGLSPALEVLLAATTFQCAHFEWDSSVWVLRRAKPDQALLDLGLTPWLHFRKAIGRASPKEYAAAKAVASQAERRPWVVRAGLAFLFSKEAAFWSADDDERLRQVSLDNYAAVAFGLLAALRHASLPKLKWLGELDDLPSKVALGALGPVKAISVLRLQRAFGALARLDDIDAIRVLGEFADGGVRYLGNEEASESVWPFLKALKPTPKVLGGLASLFTTHRPHRTIGLHLARALLRELLISAPREAAKLATGRSDAAPLIASLLAETGAGLPDDQAWVSPWVTTVTKATKTVREAPALPKPLKEERIHWAKGQREALLEEVGRFRKPDAELMKATLNDVKTGETVFIHTTSWMTDANALTLFESIAPKHWYGHVDDLQVLLARYGLKALPSIATYVWTKSDRLEAVELVESPIVAPLMAKGFTKVKKTRACAQAWLERFPQSAVLGLVPELASKDKARREAAETALSHLQDKGLAGKAQGALPNVAERPTLPGRAPKLPAFIELARLPRPIRRDGKAALSLAALEELLTALKATLPEKRELADQLASHFTASSMAALAASLFRQWLFADGPPKEKWALYASGVFADDDAARAIGALARKWAPQGTPARAQEAVEMLAMMRSPVALTEIHDIATKVQSKALKARAEKVFEAEATKLGLTAEDLADRIIPDIGLGSDGTMRFGELTVRFDSQLKARLVDASGAAVDDLPKDSDPEDVKAWASLKKAAAAVGKQQLRRLEQSLGEGRRMSFDHFSEVYLMHPLVRHVSRGVVWGAWRGEQLAQTFAVTDEGLVDASGRTVQPLVDAVYGLVHPIELSATERTKWKQRVSAPAFEQVTREVFESKSVDAVRAALARRRDEVPTGGLLGLLSRGWRRGDAVSHGCYFEMHRAGTNWTARLAFEPGISLSAPMEAPTQRLAGVELEASGAVPAAVLSELQRDLSLLVAQPRSSR